MDYRGEYMLRHTSKHEFLKSNIAFLTQFFRNPKGMGSIIPSSPLLGQAMASFVPIQRAPLILELGPGTGAITKALINSGVSREHLMCLEMSPKMITHLKRRFPRVNVIEGNACQLQTILDDNYGKVDAIVSSLPLKSIPGPVVEEIIEQIHDSLSEEGVIIQFTYDLRPSRSAYLKKFTRVNSKLVVGNVPPARVDVFKKKQTA